jgi:hypothetical protein
MEDWLELVFEHGGQSALAEVYGVSRATICRDVAAIKKSIQMVTCPMCIDGWMYLDQAEELERKGQLDLDGKGRFRLPFGN